MAASSAAAYDRASELRSFDETKSGVKGLIDSGITQIPRIFIHPIANIPAGNQGKGTLSKFSIIDIDKLCTSPVKRREIVNKVRDASEIWGFFQVINHGIPTSVLDEMIAGVWRFHDPDDRVKKQWYTRDLTKKFVYVSNLNLFKSPAADRRDTMHCEMAPKVPSLHDLPEPCK